MSGAKGKILRFSISFAAIGLIIFFMRDKLHESMAILRHEVVWGWFAGAHPDATRKRLKALKWALTAFFLVLGFATLAAYIKIGIGHADKVGERYVPASVQQRAAQPGVAQ